jgi:hypothetical protein
MLRNPLPTTYLRKKRVLILDASQELKTGGLRTNSFPSTWRASVTGIVLSKTWKVLLAL